MRRPMLPKTQGLHTGSRAARRPRHTRPSLEALEGRQLLTDGVLLQAGLTYSWDAIKQTETAAELARLDDPDAALQITQNFGQGQDAVDSQEEQQAGPAETSVVGPMWSQMLDDIQQARPLIEQAAQLEQQETPLPAEQRRPLEDQAQQLVAQAEQLIGQAEQDWYNAQDAVLTSQQGQPAPAPQSPPVTVPTIPQSPSNPQPVPSNPTPTPPTTQPTPPSGYTPTTLHGHGSHTHKPTPSGLHGHGSHTHKPTPSKPTPSGLQIVGSPADVKAFGAMLALASRQSSSFRLLLQNIQADTTHPVGVVLDNDPHLGVFDNFSSDTVFLQDIRQLPAAVPAGNDAITRGQVIAHFLAERYNEALTGAGFSTDHAAGIALENLFRQDTHQPAITGWYKQTTSGNTLTIFFSDGGEEQILYDAGEHLIAIHFLSP